jgi:ACS family tartrate transporter-like MFS transporter
MRSAGFATSTPAVDDAIDPVTVDLLRAQSLVGMSVAAIGFYGGKGPFWSMPPMFLTGMAAAASIAWINSLGNLGGFFGPSIVGWVKDLTGSFAGGLYALAAFALMAAVVSALWLHIPRRIAVQEAVAAA